jgi:hypothetical protein
MPQSGFTPIQHYRSATPAAVATAGNLQYGELFLNYADGNLFFKDSSNVVRLLASTAAATGTVSSVQASGGTTGLTFTGGPITSSGTLTLGGTLAVANGGTGSGTQAGARTNLGATVVGANVFTAVDAAAARTAVGATATGSSVFTAVDAAAARTAIGATATGSSVFTAVDAAAARTAIGATATGSSLLTAVDAAAARTAITAAARAQVDQISGFISSPANKLYRIAIKMAYAGTITETTTRSASGTCTATFAINGVNLGGTANSVSSSEQSQAHASANTFVAGDDIEMTVSSNSSCVDMSFTIAITRTLA